MFIIKPPLYPPTSFLFYNPRFAFAGTEHIMMLLLNNNPIKVRLIRVGNPATDFGEATISRKK